MAIDATSWTAIENGAYFRQLGTMITGFAGGRTDPAEVVTFFEGMKNGLDEIVSELTDNYSKNFAKNFFLFSKKDDYETLKRRTDSAKDGFNILYLLLGKTNVDKIVPPIKVDVGYEGVRKKEEELEKLIEDRDVLNADLKAKKKELSDKRSVLNKTFKPAEKKKLKDEVASLSEEIADIEKKIKDSEKEIKDMEKDVGDMRKAMKQAAREQNAARASAVDPAVNARLQYSNLVKCIEVGLAKLKDLQKQLGTVKMKDDTKGKAFDAGKITDKSVLKAFGLRGDSPVTLEMLRAKLLGLKEYVVGLRDELADGVRELNRDIDYLIRDYGLDCRDPGITKFQERKKEYDDYKGVLTQWFKSVDALIASPSTDASPEWMTRNGKKFKKEIEERANYFKGRISAYKELVKKRADFAKLLENLYVFDCNMFNNKENYKKVKSGIIPEELKKNNGNANKILVSRAQECLPIAGEVLSLARQYDHSGFSTGPWYIIIDKNGNMIEGPNVAGKRYINKSTNEANAIKEVTDVLVASLKAGEWVKLADIRI